MSEPLPGQTVFGDLETLLKHVDTKFTLVNVAMKRARQINNGAPALTDRINANKPVSTAFNEIAVGKDRTTSASERASSKGDGTARVCAESSDTSGDGIASPSSSNPCAGWNTADMTAPASPSSTRAAAWPEPKPKGSWRGWPSGSRTAGRISGLTGIGHTRWATHGRPSDENAHPHHDCSGRTGGGAQRDHRKLRGPSRELIERGHQFASETDTEVLAHLIEEAYGALPREPGALAEAVRQAIGKVSGAFAVGVIAAGAPDSLVFARNGASPLIVGLGDDEMYVASDIPAMLQYTRKMVILQEGDVAEVDRAAIV